MAWFVSKEPYLPSCKYFKQTLSSFFKSRKMKNNASSFLFAFFIFAIVFGAMGFSYYSSAQQLSEVGKTEYVLVFGLMYATFMVLMMTAYDAQNNYYKNKDYDRKLDERADKNNYRTGL